MSTDIKNIEVNVKGRFMPLALRSDRMLYKVSHGFCHDVRFGMAILFTAISVDYRYEICQYVFLVFEIVSEYIQQTTSTVVF